MTYGSFLNAGYHQVLMYNQVWHAFCNIYTETKKKTKIMERINNSAAYRKTINIVRNQIFDSIRSIMEEMCGKVCFRMYHDFDIIDLRYTFFEVDGDGYGRELFLDTAVQTPNEDITIMLHDTEDCYEPMWDLTDLTTTDALYMLEELEQIADFHAEHPDKPIITEYDADFDWENY